MEGDNGGQKVENPNPNPNKTKVVVIMGATGSGKSKLAIDLASHFPIEIINSDSMQVYQGLDVLTNKVPLHEQNGLFSLSLVLVLGRLFGCWGNWRNFLSVLGCWCSCYVCVGFLNGKLDYSGRIFVLSIFIYYLFL